MHMHSPIHEQSTILLSRQESDFLIREARTLEAATLDRDRHWGDASALALLLPLAPP